MCLYKKAGEIPSKLKYWINALSISTIQTFTKYSIFPINEPIRSFTKFPVTNVSHDHQFEFLGAQYYHTPKKPLLPKTLGTIVAKYNDSTPPHKHTHTQRQLLKPNLIMLVIRATNNSTLMDLTWFTMPHTPTIRK